MEGAEQDSLIRNSKSLMPILTSLDVEESNKLGTNVGI